ncbi:MAG: PepSY-associated TM helix domain-containing protein [Flavitalea sp.]
MGATKQKQSAFRRINSWLHLWLGLISGAIMFIVCLMAAVWVFQKEITDLIAPKKAAKYIASEQHALVLPSRIKAIGDSMFPGGFVHEISYQRNAPIAVEVKFRKPGEAPEKDSITIGLIHPYSGEFLGPSIDENLKLRSGVDNFFGWVLNGHRFLWLPYEIGRPIVNYATLIFVILLITGLIWWYPKKWNKSTRDKSFKIKWKANWKRVNIDLHNVLGFYAFLILFLLAITGIFYGLEWFNRALFWSTTGGKTLVEYKEPTSDTTAPRSTGMLWNKMDNNFREVITKQPNSLSVHIHLPEPDQPTDIIFATTEMHEEAYYEDQYYEYDQYTGERILTGNNVDDNLWSAAGSGEKFRRLNYDIHTGTVLGLPTKILAFSAALIGASLPVTGFIIWYNRKWGKKKKSKMGSGALKIQND